MLPLDMLPLVTTYEVLILFVAVLNIIYLQFIFEGKMKQYIIFFWIS